MKIKTITLLAISVNIVHATNYPELRYKQWSTLSSSEQGDAGTLGYISNTWNTPGTAAFESSTSYDTLSSNAQNAAAAFGLNDEGEKTSTYFFKETITFLNEPNNCFE